MRDSCTAQRPNSCCSVRVSVLQPKQIKEIKDFLLTARRKDASSVKIKKAPGVTKFKVGVLECVGPWRRTLRDLQGRAVLPGPIAGSIELALLVSICRTRRFRL